MNLDPGQFKAPYITRQDAWFEADRIRQLYGTTREFPLEVEEL